MAEKASPHEAKSSGSIATVSNISAGEVSKLPPPPLEVSFVVIWLISSNFAMLLLASSAAAPVPSMLFA